MALIAHYKLDDLSSSVGSSLSYQNNSGKLTTASGKLGDGYKRNAYGDGTDYLLSNENIFLSSSFTMTCWAYVTAASTSANGLVTNHNHSLNSGAGITVKYISANDYRISCNTGTGSGRTFNTYYGTSNIKDRWAHLTVRYESNSNNLSLWVDGVLEFSTTYSMYCKPDPLAIHSWSLGYNASTAYRPGAIIDDVRIYDHALSLKEVQELAKAKVLHYTFNDFQEPTENLITYDFPSFSAWSGFTGTSTIFNENGYFGVKLLGETSGGVRWAYPNTVSATPNTKYTISSILKWNGTYPHPNYWYIREYRSDNSQIREYGVFDIPGLSANVWHNVQKTITTHSECASFRVEAYQYTSPCEIWRGNLQVEKKDHATPFVNGTRTGTVLDSSGQDNDATLALATTPKWTSDSKLGTGAVDLSALGKYLTLPKSSIGTGSLTNCSISFWRKRSRTGSWIGFNSSVPSGSYVMATSNGTGAFYNSTDVGTTPKIYINGVLGTVPANDDNWNHYVITGVNISNWANIYLNAYNVNGTNSWQFAGNVDDIRIYSTALTDEQVLELYQTRASLDGQGNLLC
jgi:hypothetical protein